MLEWFAIEGLVGAGKTTTAQLVGSRLDCTVVLEQTELHPFLADYYRDPQRFALETELVFIALHLHQVKQVEGTFVSDFSPHKNLIYGELVLNTSDLGLLSNVHRHAWSELAAPSRTLFLDVPPEVCLQRIRRRGRPFEQSITLDELGELRERYDANMGSLGLEVEQIVLAGEESPEEVAETVRAHLRSR